MLRKKALVTGASEGLGRAFVKQLAAKGFDTTSVARNKLRLQELTDELNKKEGFTNNHDYIVADLATAEGVESVAARLRGTKYDLLINNAGYSCFGNFDEASIEDEINIMKVNCQATMILAHTFLQNAENGSALINLSSLTNYLPTPIQPTYVATKCFIASFSESLWFQQRKKGIYVQSLCPGITRTRFIERASTIDGRKKKLLDLIAQTPEQVVSSSLDALEKRKRPIVIPGYFNRLLSLILRFVPRKPTIWISGKLGELV